LFEKKKKHMHEPTPAASEDGKYLERFYERAVKLYRRGSFIPRIMFFHFVNAYGQIAKSRPTRKEKLKGKWRILPWYL
jgi:hypothetical protein